MFSWIRIGASAMGGVFSRWFFRACPEGARGCTHLSVPDWPLRTAEASRHAQGLLPCMAFWASGRRAMETIALEGMEWSVGRFGDRRLDKGGGRCWNVWLRAPRYACASWPAGAARDWSA